MDNDKQNLKNGGPWWKAGVEVFSEVSMWIVAPIIIALIVGKGLDTHYGTKPVIFLVFAGAGFLFTCIGIVRVVRNYTKKLKEAEQNKK